jgi:hypothetical protein
VFCLVLIRSSIPGTIVASLTIIDRAGHRSNALSFVLGIHQRPAGAARPDAPSGFDIVAESASLGGAR